MLIVVHWVLLTWVIVNCSAHVGDRDRHTREGDVNVFAEDASKASKIYGVINSGKCRPK